MTAPAQATPRELVIRDLEGQTTTIALDRDRITLGRSSANELSYPDDIGLSRQHLAIVSRDGQWTVEDLGSKNGTLLNGVRIEKPMPFGPGDRVSAGHLTIEFAGSGGANQNTVMFVENKEQFSNSATTVVASLGTVLGSPGDDLNKTTVMSMQGTPQMRALIDAGRELAGHRPLAELFPLIMDLSTKAVRAGRGVLMTLDGDQLNVRAAHGEGFQISSTVRDRVLKGKDSLLIRDAQLDQALRQHMSIVEQKVRSMIAVPLQTNDRVIGLIYVDSPDNIREFTVEDLNLLTVMANIAAIRIEHARLNEIEEAERAMAKDMHQAALIQERLLGTPPVMEGLDIGAKTVASRAVGGDYYDFIKYPDGRVGIMVGDVAGKGMPAALLMSSLQARVHVVFEEPDELAQKLTRLNKSTCANCPDNRFITFFTCIADPKTGLVTYANAGHNPPLVVRAKGGFELLSGAGGMILGILPMSKYEEATITLERGDILVLFSDGVTEEVDPNDQQFGEERLANMVAELRDRAAAEIVQEVHRAVHAFTQGAPAADDITVVIARRL
ncbi:MAG: SpoIIE family protein phosphatase [Acidobacteriia bacterium]|nr:SpoIIE family protein phosphatase [Terriglobia bacterium]